MATAVRVYVLRIWSERHPEGEVWRAYLRQGEERRYFADPRALTAFLVRELEVAGGVGLAPGGDRAAHDP